MRRRLWWLIVTNDSRVTEDHGIKIYTPDSAIDVAFPSNVNDSELYPAMKRPPTVQPRWTDMSFTLMVIEAHNALRKLSLSTPPNTSHPTESARQQEFQTLKAHFEVEYLQYCDQNIPIQRMAYLIGKLLPSKLDFVTRQIWLRHHTSTLATTSSLPGTTEACQRTERDFLHACKILEISEQFRTDDMLQGFQWNTQTYPQYHVLMFIFRYLCVSPEGPGTDRAWMLANACFSSAIPDEVGGNWTVLRSLREKAMKIRYSVSARGKGEVVNGSGAHEGQLLSGMDWSMDAFDHLYWDSMIDNVNVGNY